MRFVFLTLLVSFIFSIKNGNAQDHAAFLKECFELYQAESYKIKLKYSIYNGKSDAPVSKEILILKKGKNYLTKDSYNQVLLSDKYKLMMNKSFKTISIGYREQEEFNAPSLQGLNLDSIIGKGTQIKCISKNGAIHFYQIVNKEMPDLKTDIYIDTEKKKIPENGCWQYIVSFTLTYQVPLVIGSGTVVTPEQTLSIAYKGENSIYEAMSVFDINSPDVILRVTNLTAMFYPNCGATESVITTPYLSQLLPNDINLELMIETTRYKDIANTVISPGVNGNFTTANNLGTINWSYIEGAEQYELEWVFIDAEDNIIDNQPSGFVWETDIFKYKEPVRVETALHSYDIDLVYPNGTLFFRYRPIGKYFQDLPEYNFSGDWIFIPSTETNKGFPINIADFDKNWQFQASYAEEGKQKGIISYMDGSSRARQNITYLNTNNTSVVGETKYDNEGRGIVNFLPTPIGSRDFKFQSGFSINTFSKENYDNTANVAPSLLGINLKPEIFYSDNNITNVFINQNSDVQYSPIHTGYIPQSNGYPYSITRFTLDNTNRVVSKTIFGDMFKEGGGKEKQFFYSSTNDDELRRLVPKQYEDLNAEFYKKVYEKDENGQITIKYLDQNNKTIASCVSTVKPDNLLSAGGDIILTGNLSTTNAGNSAYFKNSVNTVFNSVFLNDPLVDHSFFTFKYSLPACTLALSTALHNPLTGDQECSFTTTVNYKYKVKFKIYDPDGGLIPISKVTEISGVTAISKDIDGITYLNYFEVPSCTSGCEDILPFVEFKVDLVDKIGTYSIVKELIIDPIDISSIFEDDNTLTCSGTSGTTFNEILTNWASSFVTNLISEDECEIIDEGDEPSINNVAEMYVKNQCNAWKNELLNQVSIVDPNCPNTGTSDPDDFLHGKYYATLATHPFWDEVLILCPTCTTSTGSVYDYFHPEEGDPLPENYEQTLFYAHPEYAQYDEMCPESSNDALTPYQESSIYNMVQTMSSEFPTWNTVTPTDLMDPLDVASDGQVLEPLSSYISTNPICSLIVVKAKENFSNFINPNQSLNDYITSLFPGSSSEVNTKRWLAFYKYYKYIIDKAIFDYFNTVRPSDDPSDLYFCINDCTNRCVFTEPVLPNIDDPQFSDYLNVPGMENYGQITSTENVNSEKYNTVYNWFIQMSNGACPLYQVYEVNPLISLEQTDVWTPNDIFIGTSDLAISDVSSTCIGTELTCNIRRAWDFLWNYTASMDPANNPTTGVTPNPISQNPQGYIQVEYDSNHLLVNEDLRKAVDYLSDEDCNLNSVVCLQNNEIYVDNWILNLTGGFELTEACQQAVALIRPYFIAYADAKCAETPIDQLYDGIIPTSDWVYVNEPDYSPKWYLKQIVELCAQCPALNIDNVTNQTVNYYIDPLPVIYTNENGESVGGNFTFTHVPTQLFSTLIQELNSKLFSQVPCSSCTSITGTSQPFPISGHGDVTYKAFLDEELNVDDDVVSIFSTLTEADTCLGSEGRNVQLYFYNPTTSFIHPMSIKNVWQLKYKPYAVDMGNLTDLQITAKVRYLDGETTKTVIASLYEFNKTSCSAFEPAGNNPDPYNPVIPGIENCTDIIDSINAYNTGQYLANLQTQLAGSLLQQIHGGEVHEQFTVQYTLNEGLTTLYYYDRAGNLVQTDSPEGFDNITDVATDENHVLASFYKYNSNNQVTETCTPEGRTLNHYDFSSGLLRYTQNLEDIDNNKRFTYFKYDSKGRVKENGVSEFPYESLTEPYNTLAAQTKFWNFPQGYFLE